MARITPATFLVAAALTGCGGGSTQTDGYARLLCPPCPSSQVCVDDPRDACNPAVAECSAICVTALSCGGNAAIACPAGQTCVDDLRDDCVSPPRADCGGLCAPAR
jgi:hypothetical protein